MHVTFSVSIVFGISTRAENWGEETIYRYLKKKVYFTIPLAVEDRDILFIGFNYSTQRGKKEIEHSIHVFSLI